MNSKPRPKLSRRIMEAAPDAPGPARAAFNAAASAAQSFEQRCQDDNARRAAYAAAQSRMESAPAAARAILAIVARW